MKRFLILTVVILIGAWLTMGFMQLKVLHPKIEEFDTIEAAAIDALKVVAAKPTGTYYEWGGQIGQTPSGKFVHSDPVTDHHGSSVSVMGGRLPGYVEPVGDYHTHPCLVGYEVEFFSPADLIAPLHFHKIGFLGDFCTGHVHEFIPGDAVDTEQAEPGIWLTKGRIVGVFTSPHDPVLE